MRPLEIVLTLLNLAAACALTIPRFRRSKSARNLILMSLGAAVVQILAEGARWQMVPAYLFTSALNVTSRLRAIVPAAGNDGRKLWVRIMKSIAMSLGTLLFAVSVILPVVFPVFALQSPTGSYQIGTVTYHWTDSSRQEIFSRNPADKRRLTVEIWYPVKGDRSSTRAPYVSDAAALSAGLTHALSSSGLLRLPSFFFDYFRYVRTHAIPNAPIAPGTAPYPVLIYLTGLDGFRQASMFQVEALVSHGYIVVGLDQPYTAAAVRFPDGRIVDGLPKSGIQPLIDQSIDPSPDVPHLNGRPFARGIIPYLADDVSFTINRLAQLNTANSDDLLTGRIDLGHIGIFGVSLGAMVAAEACHEDTRPAADMRLERSRSGGWPEKAIRETLESMRAVYHEEKPGEGFYLSIAGMFHVNFTDAPYWFPFGSRLGLTGPINGRRGFDIVDAYTLAFFDRFLKNEASPLLQGPSKNYPEADLSTR